MEGGRAPCLPTQRRRSRATAKDQTANIFSATSISFSLFVSLAYVAKIKSLESQLSDALHASDAKSTHGSESRSNGILSNLKLTGDGDTSAITRKLEEELSKRDALIERLHEENEKLFDRLTEKASLGGSPQVSSPFAKGHLTHQLRD